LFTATPPTQSYPLSLHDALPIFDCMHTWVRDDWVAGSTSCADWTAVAGIFSRDGIGRSVGLLVRDCYTRAQRLLRELAVGQPAGDRKSTRLNSSHGSISYAVFCF